jgi:hypothetical protein
MPAYVIEPPTKDDTIDAWQRFLNEMRDLPQHYAVVRSAVRKAEAELVRRSRPAGYLTAL